MARWGGLQVHAFLVLELGEGLLHAAAVLSQEKMFRVFVDTGDIVDTIEKGKMSASVGNTASAALSSRP